jgi:hypothetical protein
LPEIENIEDSLTSNIFGLLRYLSFEKGLLKILSITKDYKNRASLLDNNPNLKLYDKIEYLFWEFSSDYGEPDLIIIFNSSKKNLPPLVLVIEVKFYSGKSRSGKDDQLKDYFIALSHEKGRNTFLNEKIKNFKGEFMGLIYLTYYNQINDIEETINELSKEWVKECRNKIYELRWNDITKIFKNKDNVNLTSSELNIYEDIFLILKKKNFIDFEGWSIPPKVTTGSIFFESFYFKNIPNNVVNTVRNFEKYIFFRGGNI